MTVFAPFHVAASQEGKERIKSDCSSFHAVDEYFGLLDILFKSAQLHDVAARNVVLTDLATDLSPLEDRAHIVRSQVEPDAIMYSRLLAQINFVERELGADNAVFVDSDMIINGSLERLFAEDFDIGLTYRAHPEMPINGGVIFVKGGRNAAAARLLRQACECYTKQFSDRAHWWGDQYALIEVLGRDRFNRRTTDMLSVDGVKVRLLPCDVYNFSPDNELRAIAAPLRDKVILHFKGERKRLMPLYWGAHLAARSKFSWSAFWKAQRTRATLRQAV